MAARSCRCKSCPAHQMKLVIISGPVCSGKTTIVDILLKNVENYFHLSYDSLKWQFSQYSSGKYQEDILTLRLALLKILCEMGYNVLTESTHASTKQKHVEIAREYGYKVVEINLEADRGVLTKRMQERNESLPPTKVVPMTRFDEVFDLYEKDKNPKAITFRTDWQTVEEVSNAILKLL